MKPIQYLASVGFLLCGCDRLPVKAPPGNYDLEATSVTHKPIEVFVGDPVVFDTVISNIGKDPIPARSYQVDLYLEKDRISFDHATSTIPPGGNIPYSMAPGYHHWKPTMPGTYKYRFLVDERNQLLETNEGNNEITGDIIVKAKPKGEQAVSGNRRQRPYFNRSLSSQVPPLDVR